MTYNVSSGTLNTTIPKAWTLVIAPLTWVRLVTSSALQSRKWQLIGMSHWYRSALCGHPLPVLTDNWIHGAASRHTITLVSHTRPSPHSRSYYKQCRTLQIHVVLCSRRHVHVTCCCWTLTLPLSCVFSCEWHVSWGILLSSDVFRRCMSYCRCLIGSNCSQGKGTTQAHDITLTIAQLHILQILLIVHNFLYHNNDLPEVFKGYFVINNSIHSYSTRYTNLLCIDFFKWSVGQRSINCEGSIL